MPLRLPGYFVKSQIPQEQKLSQM